MTTHSNDFCGIHKADLAADPDLTDRESLLAGAYPYLISISKKRLGYAAGGDVAVGADDLVQTAALNVHRNLEQFDAARGSFTTFLGLQVERAASNTRSRTTAKKRRRPCRTPQRLAAVADPKTPRPADVASEHDVADRLWDVVARLVTERELTVLRLRFAEGMEFEQIGGLLGVRWQAAWQSCDSALAKLRDAAERLRESFGC